MKTLLEVFLKHFDFLYLDPRYRITDSTSSGVPTIDAQMILRSDVLSWSLTNDRGQMTLAVAPSLEPTSENWFRLSIVRRYLDGDKEAGSVLTVEGVDWLSANISLVESLFAGVEATKASCKALLIRK